MQKTRNNLIAIEGHKKPEITIKNCMNCGHRCRGKCLLSGYPWEIERRFPSSCGRNFQGWVQAPKKLGMIQRIKRWFKQCK